MPQLNETLLTSPKMAGVFRRLKEFVGLGHKRSDLTGASGERLKVYLFNVGQGDHVLLEFPNGHYGIIDFYFEGTLGLKEPPALTYLENVKRLHPENQIVIAFICISHTDFDHVKGIDTFLKWAEENEIRIDNFWLPSGDEFWRVYEIYEKALTKYAKSIAARDEGLDLKDRLRAIRDFQKSKSYTSHTDAMQGAIRSLHSNIGGGGEVVLIAPLAKHLKKFDEQVWMDFFRWMFEKKIGDSAQANLTSSILLVILRKHKLLFGGDAELDVWTECLDDYERTNQKKYFGPCVANFIKVSHHGSNNSSSLDLWKRILDKDVKVGISAGRRYGHPHSGTLRDISGAAREIGSTVQILSTNTCTHCFLNQNMPEQPLGELVYDPPQYPSEVKQTLNRIRALPGPGVPRATLGAYIFRFPLEGERVSVAKGLRYEVKRNVTCIYNNSLHHSFPDCAQ